MKLLTITNTTLRIYACAFKRSLLVAEGWILIINDGSKDNTARIADQYAAAYPTITSVPSRKQKVMVEPWIRGWRTQKRGSTSKSSIVMTGWMSVRTQKSLEQYNASNWREVVFVLKTSSMKKKARNEENHALRQHLQKKISVYLGWCRSHRFVVGIHDALAYLQYEQP